MRPTTWPAPLEGVVATGEWVAHGQPTSYSHGVCDRGGAPPPTWRHGGGAVVISPW
nr:hypothetical protein Iba_chr06bCG17670 [Ipomoea batatas]